MGSRKQDRLNRLVSLLEQQQTVPVRELARTLGVSEMTIRRDLDELRENDLVDRSYGKATLRRSSTVESLYDNYEFHLEQGKMNEEKNRIGKFAATLVQPGDVISIDTGSTTDKLAKYLPEELECTVLCYNFNVLHKVIRKPLMNIIFPGGYFHPNGQFFESPQGISLIEENRVNKIFLAASGVHQKLGITCANNYEVLTKRAALQSAQTRILLADSSKFGRVRPAYFAQLAEMDAIVTDTALPADWRETIAAAGIVLHLV